ncbi:ferritin family protein [Limisalsivibrio acetivorans]|uniref:ferritin family protein n=1 Tax=Limisalsivibrio acetivorans TaxID=1304888 RepID=UPI0003B53194|nr:ferritin family protein [Limisalsivibrio acetivorans]
MDADVRKALEEAKVKKELSFEFYEKLLNVVSDLSTKALIKDLMEQKDKHTKAIKEALEQGSLDGLGLDVSCRWKGLGIGKNAKPEVVTGELTVQDVLLIAIRYEENSVKYYEDLAEKFKGQPAGDVFDRLASDEACHRNDIQRMYDDIVNMEN